MKPLLSIKKDIPISGEIAIPADKSISHRSLIFASLANGKSKIFNLLKGEDVLRTAKAMELMGVEIEEKEDHLAVNGSGVVGLMEPNNIFDLGNSGTSSRLLAGLVSPYDFTTNFTGDDSLRKRPMKRVFDPIKQIGAKIIARENNFMPFTIIGAKNPLPIEFKMNIASAQVKSAILLASLAINGTTTIIEPEKCRDHTEIMMRYLGLKIEQKNHENGTIINYKGFQDFAAKDFTIPADISSAAFIIVAALIVKGSKVTLKQVGINKLRSGIIDSLLEMGANIRLENEDTINGEDVADIIIESSNLKGVEIPASRAASMIDEYPILAIAAANAQGVTKMNGLAELKVKESNRLLMIAENLKLCGVNVKMGDDYLEIEGGINQPKSPPTIITSLDHRIAMSFLIMGLKLENGLIIDDSNPIKTSFPNFEEIFRELGNSFEATNS